MNKPNEILDYIFDKKKTAFSAEFEAWLKASRRFKAFAIRYQDKIRSKLRSAGDASKVKDLRAEIATAAFLLQEESFTLEYEKYAASKQRSPDFTVTFKTHTPFNVEIRRIRSIELGETDKTDHSAKLMAILCDKVGQMSPNMLNLLWLIDERKISLEDLNQATSTLRQLADSKTETFFSQRGFASATAFLKQYQHLSAIVVQQNSENLIWHNNLARHKIPREIINALQRLN